PSSASPLCTSLGKWCSLSHLAAYGHSCSWAKARTASRIMSWSSFNNMDGSVACSVCGLRSVQGLVLEVPTPGRVKHMANVGLRETVAGTQFAHARHPALRNIQIEATQATRFLKKDDGHHKKPL